MIKEIAFVAYPSNDVKSTREWYEKTLGLTFSGPYVEDGVESYNESSVNGTCFSLMKAEWLERAAGTGAGVAFEVENMDEALAQLQAKGVTVGEPYDTPVCRIASFNDPEGNKITFHQITVPH